MSKKCCESPRLRLYSFNSKGKQKDICDNCGKETEWYEPELGQAMFGNPTQTFSFDDMPDNHVVEYLLRIISFYATGDESYSGEFENDVFELRPYYWGDDENIANLPNFRHKNSGLEISWYKYIGRGMSVNKHVCPNCFYDIFVECMNSINKSV